MSNVQANSFKSMESYQTTKTMVPEGHITMACDGAYSGNSGKGGWAFYDGVNYQNGVLPGPTTNNIAEYTGLIKLLEHILKMNRHLESIMIMMDSQLVVYQINGSYRVKDVKLIPLHAKASALLSATNAKVMWVPRETPIMNQVDGYAKAGSKM